MFKTAVKYGHENKFKCSDINPLSSFMPQTDTWLLDKICDFILFFFKMGSFPEAPLAGSKHISGQRGICALPLPQLLWYHLQ